MNFSGTRRKGIPIEIKIQETGDCRRVYMCGGGPLTEREGSGSGFHLDIFGYGNIPLEDLIDLNALDKFVESCGKQNS